MFIHTEVHYDCNDDPILDEYGQTIPTFVCICHAFSADECSCGAWGKEDERLKEW
jgi:hypothetical protein